ncbi:MAG TPA: hypothetical protein VJ905_04455 [Halalkalibaculum sp.]|nr:hypothetical protein [Halalkalibaculum sp.]
MKNFKVVFESGVTETIKAGKIELNDVLDKVVVEDDQGKEMKQHYLNFEHISAVIPQD